MEKTFNDKTFYEKVLELTSEPLSDIEKKNLNNEIEAGILKAANLGRISALFPRQFSIKEREFIKYKFREFKVNFVNEGYHEILIISWKSN